MNLYEKLFSQDDEVVRIGCHLFEAAMVEYMRENISKNQMISAWTLDSEAESDLTIILAAVDGLTSILEKLTFLQELSAVNILAEAGLMYTTRLAWATRLGLV